MKNFFTITLLAAGTPMLLMGDEVRRTQRGNNNIYCQNNEVSWFDWKLLGQHADVRRFIRMLVAQRLRLIGGAMGEANEMTRRTDAGEWLRGAKVQLHGVVLNQPDFGSASHSITFTVQDVRKAWHLHVMLNAHWEPLAFELPKRSTDSQLCGGARSTRRWPRRTTSWRCRMRLPSRTNATSSSCALRSCSSHTILFLVDCITN